MAVPQCPSAVAAVEDACFSGRGFLPRSALPNKAAFGGLPVRRRLVQRCRNRATPRCEHGETAVGKRAPDMQTAARLRLHSLINRVQG